MGNFGKHLKAFSIFIILLIPFEARPSPTSIDDMVKHISKLKNFDIEHLAYESVDNYFFDSLEIVDSENHRRQRRSVPIIPVRYRHNSDKYGFVRCKFFQWKTATSCRFVRTGR